MCLWLAPILPDSPMCRAQAILDGDFDSLPVGTAPDNDVPAGAWHFTQGLRFVNELDDPEVFTIVPTDSFSPGSLGNSLRINGAESALHHVTNRLVDDQRFSGEYTLRFDTYVVSGGGGSIYIAGNHRGGEEIHDGGANHNTDRGPQLVFEPDGRLSATVGSTAPNGPATSRTLGEYEFDEWLTYEIRGNVVGNNGANRFDLYAVLDSGELSEIASNIPFRSRALAPEYIDRVTLAHFGLGNTEQYFDNIRFVPEPTSFGLLPLALFCLIARLLRK